MNQLNREVMTQPLCRGFFLFENQAVRKGHGEITSVTGVVPRVDIDNRLTFSKLRRKRLNGEFLWYWISREWLREWIVGLPRKH